MDTNALYRAMENRMLHNMAQPHSVGKKARHFRDRLFDEARNLPKDGEKDAILTPLQKRVREDVDDIIGGLTAVFAAFDRHLADENVEEDPASLAAVQLLSPLVGRILALELRVAALEAALD